jgi:sensor domain CHASE-containing protein
VTRPVSLQEGGRALFVCAPIFVENKLSGFLLGIIRSQELFSSILQDLEQSYWVALYDGDQEIYSSPDLTRLGRRRGPRKQISDFDS